METCSGVSDDCDTEMLDSNNDIPTSSCKQLQPCPLDFTSYSETSREGKGSSELDSSDDKISDMWCKTDKKSQQWTFCWYDRFEYTN
jgi:hypothetical protein